MEEKIQVVDEECLIVLDLLLGLLVFEVEVRVWQECRGGGKRLLKRRPSGMMGRE